MLKLQQPPGDRKWQRVWKAELRVCPELMFGSDIVLFLSSTEPISYYSKGQKTENVYVHVSFV